MGQDSTKLTPLGWLDREGNFYECAYRDHDKVIWEKCDLFTWQAEEQGFVKIYIDYHWANRYRIRSNSDGRTVYYLNVNYKLTKPQYDWLLNNNFYIPEEDISE